MTTPNEQQHDIQKVRRNLAYFWSVVAAAFLFLVTIKWGDKAEILTLLIGFVLGGSIVGAIMGTYFNVSPTPSKPSINQQADTITNSPAMTEGDTTTTGTSNTEPKEEK